MSNQAVDPLTMYIDQHRLVTTDDILNLTGFSRSTIDRWRAKGIFPQPAFKQGGSNVWLLRDVHRWLETRISNGG
ncbi:helix-turn-helix domain-containing protein [Shewanella algae]|uniref:helix-turn-helix transcriptional regulator n=2 Tax=Shewanellaceae TaxID=267890 RepID=UPI001AAEE2EB|nr:AlpA family phage regulatory protein [Shewanella algae]MBO2546560.1 AlpA family phage regulatory protein [Shewanella algae]